MKTARVFKSGNSQAVRLLRDFNLDVGKVQVFWKDGDVVLRPLKKELALRGIPLFRVRFVQNFRR
jgi:antitoxin VapB